MRHPRDLGISRGAISAYLAQTLLARELGASAADADSDGEGGGGRDGAVRGVLWRACAYGVTISSGLALFTLANVNNVVNGLTTDAAVRAAAARVMPVVLVCQAIAS